MPPLFSVVIPTYNRKELLKKSIDSVLSQDFKDCELLIIDDGSTDDSILLMLDYPEKGITYIRTSNRGVSHARNTGIQNSRGRYIAFLDSDDCWQPNKLQQAHDAIVKFPEISLFHTEETWMRNGRELKQKDKYRRRSGNIYRHCLPLCCIGMSTLVVKKSLFSIVGLFDEKMPACEDYDFFLRATLENEVKLIPLSLTVKHGGRDDQLSTIPGLDKYRIYAIEKILKSGQLSDENLEHTVHELEKKCKIFAKGCEKRGRIVEAKKYYDKINQYSKGLNRND